MEDLEAAFNAHNDAIGNEMQDKGAKVVAEYHKRRLAKICPEKICKEISQGMIWIYIAGLGSTIHILLF